MLASVSQLLPAIEVQAQNCVETLALRARVPTSISRSPKLPLVFL